MQGMTTIVTHSGSFHADDVFAVATLRLVLNDAEVNVIRTRDESVIAVGEWVVDVGGEYDPARQRFDHHQPGAPVRENGLPYAAFGLVWQHVGAALCDSEAVAQRIEEKLVQPIDAGDNGVSLYNLNKHDIHPYELYQVVGSFAPPWGSAGSKDEAFMEAVAWAEGFLERVIKQQRALQAMEEVVHKTYEATEDKRVLVFDTPVSALAAVQFPEVEVVVYPDDVVDTSRWKVNTVRKNFDSFEARVNFPETWAGLRDEELQQVTGIPDAVFCHSGRFLCVVGSKESALKAAGEAR
jgi:uncharacterized UPF0160 family protein